MAPQDNNSSVNSSSSFSVLVKKVSEKLSSLRGLDKSALNANFCQLNNLDFKVTTVEDKHAVACILRKSSSIDVKDVDLQRNYCKFFLKAAQAGVLIDNGTIVKSKEWVLHCLNNCDENNVNELLSVLQCLLAIPVKYEQSDNITSVMTCLSSIHKSQGNRATETQYLVVSCIETVLSKDCSALFEKSSKLFTNDPLRVALTLLQSLEVDRQFYERINCLCLKICRLIVKEKLDLELLGQILGLIKEFLFHGIKGYNKIRPEILRPAIMNLPERSKSNNYGNYKNPANINKAKFKKEVPKKGLDRKINNQDSNLVRHSSDSETSDMESSNPTIAQSKVRFEAVNLLNAVISNTPSRELFGYWPQLVSCVSSTDAKVLSNYLLSEPVSKSRQAALTCLTDLLVGAKIFLMHAEDQEHSSFVTFFNTVSSMIKELHLTMGIVISTERNVAVLTQALKCAAALVQSTPYSRLKSGLVTRLIGYCKRHLHHKDPTIKIAALSVFQSLAWIESKTPEIVEILSASKKSKKCTEQSSDQSETETSELLNASYDNTDNDIEYEEDNDFEELEEKKSFLIQICLKNILTGKTSPILRLKSTKVLGALAFNHEQLIFPCLESIATALICEEDAKLLVRSFRVLEIIGGHLDSSSMGDNKLSSFWDIVLSPTISLAQHPEIALREVACDCLCSIGSRMMSQLSRDRCINIITTLFGATRDEESAVRAAGLRGLGMLITFPSLDEDTGFLLDLVDAVCIGLSDSNMGVRAKAAWALGNLCDCITKRKDNEDVEPLPLNAILPKLYEVSVKSSNDNEKVKCNAVRAIGTILLLCQENQETRIHKDTSMGLEALIKCATVGKDMKVKWNACRAIGLVLSKNPDSVLPLNWRGLIFPELSTLICDSPNFKVRTNAAWALSTCNSYGKYVPTMWKSIAIALENSKHVPNYVEYPHRDTLVQQLCLTLCHLALYTDKQDLQTVWMEIGDHKDSINSHLKHFQEHILPEKAGDLGNAESHFSKYSTEASTTEDRFIAGELANLFAKSNRYDNLDIM